MNDKRLLQRMINLTFIVCLLTSCNLSQFTNPASISGIDTPIIVNDVQLLITSVAMKDSHQGFKPKSSGDVMLIVFAELSSPNGSEITTDDWDVSITDADGREGVPGVTSRTTGVVNGKDGTFIEWMFAVDRQSRSFTLHLPGDQTVTLDSLVGKEQAD